MSKCTLIVFDCDGTLSDSRATIVSSVQRAFAGQDLPIPSPLEIQRRVGLSLEEFVRDLIPDRSIDAARLVRDYRADARRKLGRSGADPLFPGVSDLLRDLVSAGRMLAIATGKSQRGLRALLEHHGVLSCFASLQTADDAPSKPHPGMILAALKECGVPKENAVMVGDTVFDMEAAANAGVGAVGVSWGYHGEPELLAAGAREVVRDIPSLRRSLDLQDS